MTDPNDPDLLQELRLMAGRVDPVPDEVVAAARSAILWRTIDAELAELTADSSVEDNRLVGVRGAAALPLVLSFEVGGQTLELEISETGTTRRLLGQLIPGQPGQVVVHHGRGEEVVAADEVGRFDLASVPAGPVRVRWQRTADPTEQMVATDWFLV
jgi:hypothetical protein